MSMIPLLLLAATLAILANDLAPDRWLIDRLWRLWHLIRIR